MKTCDMCGRKTKRLIETWNDRNKNSLDEKVRQQQPYMDFPSGGKEK